MSESDDLIKYIRQKIKTGGTISMENFKQEGVKDMDEDEVIDEGKYGKEYDEALDEYIEETCRMQDEFYTNKKGKELREGIEEYEKWFDQNEGRFVKQFMAVGLTREEALDVIENA